MNRTEFEQLVVAARFSADAEKKLEQFMDEWPEQYEQFTGHKPHGRDEAVLNRGFFSTVSEFKRDK